MSSHYEAPVRDPLVLGNKSYHDITVDIAYPIENKLGKLWWIAFGIAMATFLFGFGCIAYTIGTGIGVWGLNRTINWAWDITNFVWWVGIGHAGTLISAVLLLFRQKWRMSINRSAEAMTIFAVVQAALFPLIHMGRPWLGYFVFPVPNNFGSLWVNFNSPLLWDVFAISTYFSVSVVFWYMGLIPDFAMIRDRATKPFSKKIYGILSFGWGGKAKHWQRFEELSLVLAGLATPLVFSVHTIVSFDFATSVIKGWHSTVYPPYFVAGAIFSGFAMVQTLLSVMRKVMKMEAYITRYHIEMMNIVIVVTGGMVTVAYACEFWIGWYSGSRYEDFTYFSPGAAVGPYWWAFWALIICNLLIPATLWIRKLRRNFLWTFIVSIVVNIGMWFERFDIIVINLSRDYLPSSWTMFMPTFVDVGIFLGTCGFFSVLYLLYARTFPVIAQAELKTIMKSSGEYHKQFHSEDGHHHADNHGHSHIAQEEVKEASNNLNDVVDTAEEEVSYTIDQTKKPDSKSKLSLSDEEIQAKKEELFKSIGSADSDKIDDLKVILGIGPKLEQVLHSMGITTYNQVSKMTKKEYDLLDQLTGHFPGRAERDDWAGQAKKLLKG